MSDETKADFELATREKLRFPSKVGQLTAEDLWDLPLTSRGNQASLDSVARTIYDELKTIGEISFVDARPNPRGSLLQKQLDIVKRVIQVKQEDRDAAKKQAERAQERQQLLEILASKQTEELRGMSREDLERRIAELS